MLSDQMSYCYFLWVINVVYCKRLRKVMRKRNYKYMMSDKMIFRYCLLEIKKGQVNTHPFH